jgi:hypothetical protein
MASMPRKTTMSVVEAYRAAAMKLYGISREQAEFAIVEPSEDSGEWAPKSHAILYLEREALAQLDYWGYDHLGECVRLADEAGFGFIETINPAVAAVWD